MKRVSFFSIYFIIFVFVIAAPAIALDFDISGHYVVKHYSNSNETMDNEDVRNSYSSMELILKPILNINENIKLSFEVAALQNHIWGTHAQPIFQQENPLIPPIDSGNNVDWKSAYMTLRTGIGGFLIGRGIEKRWGTGLGDSTGSHGSNSKHKDGILWVVPVGNFISGLGWQHIIEADKGRIVTDADFDKTYLFSAYKKDDWHSGLLFAHYDHKNFVTLEELRSFQIGYSEFQHAINAYKRASALFGYAYRMSEHLENIGYYEKAGLTKKAEEEGHSSVTRWELEKPGSQITNASNGSILMNDLHALMIDADVAQAFATSAGAKIKDGPARSILDLNVLDPYLIGDFGKIRIEAELLYGWGKISLDELKFNAKTSSLINVIDVEGLAATIGAWYSFNEKISVGTGVTYVQGDNASYNDGKFSAIGYLEPSVDFERGFLLNSDISQIGLDFGGTTHDGVGLGNLSGGPLSITGTSGYKMFWIETKHNFSEQLEIGFICLGSHADTPPLGRSSDHGIEYDLKIKWKIMDNLIFDGTIAYLDAGNFWEDVSCNKGVHNLTAIHGKLSVLF